MTRKHAVAWTGQRHETGALVYRIELDEHVHNAQEQPRPVSHRPSLEVANHSPSGFEWGYHGSGPAQLALAILLDFGLPVSEAERLHQRFKEDKIAPLTSDVWRLNREEVIDWIVRVKRESLQEA